MGNSSCNPVFDEIALLSRGTLNIDRDNRIMLLAKLISLLQDQDWDTEDESLADFKDDEAVVEAFRRNGIIIRCSDENWENSQPSFCERERGAPGHADGQHEGMGRKWPVTHGEEPMKIIVGDGPGNMPLGRCMQEAADAEREFSMQPPRLSAELVVGGMLVRVPSVPVPAPTSSGHITVDIPYPKDAQAGYLSIASVTNEELDITLMQKLQPRPWVRPGDTVSFQFGEESIDLAQVSRVFGETS